MISKESLELVADLIRDTVQMPDGIVVMAHCDVVFGDLPPVCAITVGNEDVGFAITEEDIKRDAVATVKAVLPKLLEVIERLRAIRAGEIADDGFTAKLEFKAGKLKFRTEADGDPHA